MKIVTYDVVTRSSVLLSLWPWLVHTNASESIGEGMTTTAVSSEKMIRKHTPHRVQQ